ncbi:MAG: phosphopantetheine-binding protein [Oscillospiraceae bacterium]|jgi:acyl carrier protein|nr:phosphopantetheine-binding protein [Oscillospiraceae bacterium]
MLDKIKSVICEFVNIDPKSLTEATDLRVDLGLKSLDLVNLAVALENEFNIEIPDREISSIATIGDIIGYLKQAS